MLSYYICIDCKIAIIIDDIVWLCSAMWYVYRPTVLWCVFFCQFRLISHTLRFCSHTFPRIRRVSVQITATLSCQPTYVTQSMSTLHILCSILLHSRPHTKQNWCSTKSVEVRSRQLESNGINVLGDRWFGTCVGQSVTWLRCAKNGWTDRGPT